MRRAMAKMGAIILVMMWLGPGAVMEFVAAAGLVMRDHPGINGGLDAGKQHHPDNDLNYRRAHRAI